MTLTFKARSFSATEARPNHRDLLDITLLSLTEDKYTTGEALAEELRMPRETILQILDKCNIIPIAKIVNRGAVSAEHPFGKPKGGRPRLAFDTDKAKEAIFQEIEARYNK